MANQWLISKCIFILYQNTVLLLCTHHPPDEITFSSPQLDMALSISCTVTEWIITVGHWTFAVQLVV